MELNRLNRCSAESDDEEIAFESNSRDKSRRRRKLKKRNLSGNLYSSNYSRNDLPLETEGVIVRANTRNTSLPSHSIRRHNDQSKGIYQNKKYFRSFVVVDYGSERNLPLATFKTVTSPDADRKRYKCQPIERQNNFNAKALRAYGSEYCFVSPDLGGFAKSNGGKPDLWSGPAANIVNSHQQTVKSPVRFSQTSDHRAPSSMTTSNEVHKAIHNIQINPKLNNDRLRQEGKIINKSITSKYLLRSRSLPSATIGKATKYDSASDGSTSSSKNLDFHLITCSKHLHDDLTSSLLWRHLSPVLMPV